MAELTADQRRKLQAFSESKTEEIGMGAAETGLSAAMAGGALGAKIGTVGGVPGAAIGAGVGLLAGGLIGGIKAWQQHGALSESQKTQMQLENRAAAEQKRQSLRERGRAGAELSRAYKAAPTEVSGTAMSPGVSSYDAYKARNYGG